MERLRHRSVTWNESELVKSTKNLAEVFLGATSRDEQMMLPELVVGGRSCIAIESERVTFAGGVELLASFVEAANQNLPTWIVQSAADTADRHLSRELALLQMSLHCDLVALKTLLQAINQGALDINVAPESTQRALQDLAGRVKRTRRHGFNSRELQKTHDEILLDDEAIAVLTRLEPIRPQIRKAIEASLQIDRRSSYEVPSNYVVNAQEVIMVEKNEGQIGTDGAIVSGNVTNSNQVTGSNNRIRTSYQAAVEQSGADSELALALAALEAATKQAVAELGKETQATTDLEEVTARMAEEAVREKPNRGIIKAVGEQVEELAEAAAGAAPALLKAVAAITALF